VAWFCVTALDYVLIELTEKMKALKIDLKLIFLLVL